MIFDNLLDLNITNLFFHMHGLSDPQKIFLKFESFNFAGSIKLKPAIHILNTLEARGEIQKGKNKIIESSSGNFGVALSLACKVMGYEFMCVMDPNGSASSKRRIELLGGQIIMVTDRDKNGGFLESRIKKIKEITAADNTIVWVNQYSREENSRSHYLTTGPEILREFPEVDFLFIGAGTTGTLNGCARYIKENSPATKIIAVDAEGSVTFGFPPQKRLLTGLGTSFKPQIATFDNIDDVMIIKERDTISMANQLIQSYGLFVGASTASVLFAIQQYFREINAPHVVVAISPDLGEKYFDTLYNPEWVHNNYYNE